MEIEINKTETELTLNINGSIDTVTAPQLESLVKQHLADTESIIMDFTDVEYVSSAGLRVLIFTKKSVANLKLININEDVMDIFEMTGFDVLLGI